MQSVRLLLESLRTPRIRSRGHERGATAVEYALMAGSIAVAIAATVGVLGTQLADVFQTFLEQMGWA